MTEQILLQKNSEYRIGAVTYQVAALFDPSEQSLKQKLIHILKDDLRKLPSACLQTDKRVL